MNINRNNYEGFFLLYADGELRADERVAVEGFVAANEDLKIELQMIQAAVLPVEEIVFIDKSFLYKAPIFDTVLQTKLLLKIDNELAPIELEVVNEIVASNSAAKKELELLQCTKLDVEEKIVFAEKYLLYKKERENVIAFGWLRWAAAAIFIGFGLFFGVKIVNNKQTGNSTEVASVNKSVENKNATIVNDSLKNIVENVVIINVATTNTNDNSSNEINVNRNNEKKIIEELNTTNNSVASQKNIVAKKDSPVKTNAASKTTIYDPKNVKQTLLVINQNKYLPDGKQLPVEKTIPIKNEPIIIAAINQLVDTKQPIIKDENIVPLETNYSQAIDIANVEKNENKILYMDEDAVKHTKVGGFFRKVKRFVERTANIKTGNTLQIAGFEIAAR